MKTARVAAGVFWGVLAAAGVLWADGVLKTDMSDPGQVVAARKAMMHAIKYGVGDMAKKFEAGAVADIASNASALEVMGRVMPPLFRDPYSDVYDGNGKYFKGAPAAEFEAASEAFRAGAQSVFDAAAAGDKAAIPQRMVDLQKSCGACHKAYRGAF